MKVRNEIRLYAEKEAKPALNWLFDRYHMEYQWNFVADCTFKHYGTLSYQSHRVWTPTPEGWALYRYDQMIKLCPKDTP